MALATLYNVLLLLIGIGFRGLDFCKFGPACPRAPRLVPQKFSRISPKTQSTDSQLLVSLPGIEPPGIYAQADKDNLSLDVRQSLTNEAISHPE